MVCGSPMINNEKKVQERLKTDILSALRRVYAEDGKLLLRDIGVCERSLMHRFTHYFINRIESSRCKIYEGLRADGEYNRHRMNSKRLAGNLIFLSDGVEMKWFCNGVECGEYEKHVLPKRLPQSRAG